MFFVNVDQIEMMHTKKLCFAGAICDVRTNSSDLAQTLDLLSNPTVDHAAIGFGMRIVVDESSAEVARDAHFRGLHHVVTASFGNSNIFVFDILRRTLSANVSGVVAQDYRFWKEKLIPIALGVLGSAMGLVPVHCACLELDGEGLLIAGESGAGKSTLSVALVKSGFHYVSDDWTYISPRCDGIVAFGTSAPVKLLPDATAHFENLRDHNLQTSMNGELAYEVEVSEAFGAQVKRTCKPRWLILLERTKDPGAQFTPLSSGEARRYITSNLEQLPRQLHEAAKNREQTIDRVALLPCWRFQYGGRPQFAAQELWEFVQHRRQEVYA
jgi:hypothetical protein